MRDADNNYTGNETDIIIESSRNMERLVYNRNVTGEKHLYIVHPDHTEQW